MNFKAIKRTVTGWGPFGSAWANFQSIESQGFDIGSNASGIVIGAWEGRPLVDTSLRPAVVIGPCRSGKGASVLVPTMLTWRDSAVVIDINGELSSLTEGWRQSNAHNAIRRIRFGTDAHSDGYNFLAAVRRDTTNELDDMSDLLNALAPGWLVDPKLITEVRAVLLLGMLANRGNNGASLQEVGAVLAELPQSNAVLYAYRKYAFKPDIYQAGEMAANCFARLAYDEQIRVLDASRRLIADVMEPVAHRSAPCGVSLDELLAGPSPTTLYVTVMAHELARARRWLQTLFAQIVARGVSEDPHGDLHPLLMVLDEFEELGRFDFLFEAMEELPARGIKLLLAARSLVSVGDSHGIDANTWAKFSIRTILPVREHWTAVALADEIVEVSRKASHPGSTRPAITADELRAMRTRDAVILGATDKPIYTSMLRYYEDTVYRNRAAIPRG